MGLAWVCRSGMQLWPLRDEVRWGWGGSACLLGCLSAGARSPLSGSGGAPHSLQVYTVADEEED